MSVRTDVVVNLPTVMVIAPIRDEIMYWLRPIDALNLRLTCKEMVPGEDMHIYTSPFKYIIPNRQWLLKKVSEGYTFTLVSGRLGTMMNTQMIVDVMTPVGWDFTGETWAMIEAALVVTKGGHFVAGNETFMPRHLFMTSADERITETTIDTKDCLYRIIYTDKHEVGLTIAIPSEFVFKSEFISLPSDVLALPTYRTDHDDHGSHLALGYVHLGHGQDKIVDPVWDALTDEETDSPLPERLFSLATDDGYWIHDKDLCFHIGRPHL